MSEPCWEEDARDRARRLLSGIWRSEGYVVEIETFSAIAICEESLESPGDDYSDSFFLPFCHSLGFEDLGKAESAE